MENSNINPTRMELRKVREKLKVATKGHSLLKDKTSGLIKIFYQIINETRSLRKTIEDKLKTVVDGLQYTKTNSSNEEVEFLFKLANKKCSFNFGQVSHLGTVCPNVEIKEQKDNKPSYSPLSSSFQFDVVTDEFLELFPQIIKLANAEKSAYILADEIEKCKRRTKALENILIPQYENDIQKIELKLAETELENTSRLKTIKNKKI